MGNKSEQSVPAGNVWDICICVSFLILFFFTGYHSFLYAVNRVVCRVQVATVSFAPFY